MKSKLLFPLLIFLTGCSMMPYNDDFACQGGSNTKICASVSDVYLMDESKINSLQERNKLKSLSLERQISLIDRYKQENNYLFYKVKVEKNKNRDYERMIESIELSKLEKPIVIELNKNNKNKKRILNKYIKVCVLNANIRKAPNCKAKIVKVVHKGDKLYALYEQNEWIKLKDNNFIHRSITNEKCN